MKKLSQRAVSETFPEIFKGSSYFQRYCATKTFIASKAGFLHPLSSMPTEVVPVFFQPILLRDH